MAGAGRGFTCGAHGALAAELARRKFSGVTVHAEACRTKHRTGLVVAKVAPSLSDPLAPRSGERVRVRGHR